MNRFLYILIIFTFISFNALSQIKSNSRNYRIHINSDTIKLDSLSIIPSSFQIHNKYNLINHNEYKLNFGSATLYVSKTFRQKYKFVQLTYLTFPFLLEKKHQHRKLSLISTKDSVGKYSFFNHSNSKNEKTYGYDMLTKSGSISRGISVGNNQDASINSNMNFQLSGKISDKINILAAISDENIPVQPEGNSYKLNEFDKVFIKLYSDSTSLIMGDINIKDKDSYFLKFNKNSRGANYSTLLKKANLRIHNTTAVGIAKGQYNRMQLKAIDGNQGPYKLIGKNNEQYIIIISNSEKVYIDGKQLKRGEQYDYIIDYNTGEIIFTPNIMITKDKRIVIEFEYSERNYSRFQFYNSTVFQTKHNKFWLTILSESDSKSQTLDVDLSKDQKKILENIGDNTNNAFALSETKIDYSEDIIVYKKTDTLVNDKLYKNIYKQTYDNQENVYKLNFTNLGHKKGNYIRINSNANGTIYKWIAPINGESQGDYEPIKLLITPKKKQIISLGTHLNISKKTSSDFEIALSNNDQNLFSNIDDKDNIGLAVKFKINHNYFRDTSNKKLNTKLFYEFKNKNFSFFENYRNIEFNRNWNILNNNSLFNDHYIIISNSYKQRKFNINHKLNFFNQENYYKGLKNNLTSNLKSKLTNFSISISNMLSDDDFRKSEFSKANLTISQVIKKMKIGVKIKSEYNKLKSKDKDTLLVNSFANINYELYGTLGKKDNITLSYDFRKDFKPTKNSFENASVANNFKLNFNITSIKNHKLFNKITYRKLKNYNSLNNTLSENLLSQTNYRFKFFKGALSGNTNYEIGSGLEAERIYSFIKVNAGQGIYTWVDYNKNNIKELNEFELSKFKDQAEYVKVFSIGKNYNKVFNNSLNISLNIKFRNLLKKKKNLFYSFIQKLSNRFNYKTINKSSNNDILKSANPFINIHNKDILTKSEFIKNTLQFNNKNKLIVKYSICHNKSKQLLNDLFENKKLNSNSYFVQYKITRHFHILNKILDEIKHYNSEYFTNKNYTINKLENELQLKILASQKINGTINWVTSNKKNKLGLEKADINKFTGEINYNMVNKWSSNFRFDYVNIHYNSDSNTPIGYEILESLNPGDNFLWNFSFRKKISKYFQMNLVYNGRKSSNINTIHFGQIQLKANF